MTDPVFFMGKKNSSAYIHTNFIINVRLSDKTLILVDRRPPTATKFNIVGVSFLYEEGTNARVTWDNISESLLHSREAIVLCSPLYVGK